MSIKLNVPELTELKPKINVVGVGGAGGNAINNMIASGLAGVEFVAANTDAQALSLSSAEHRIQMGVSLTEGLGAGSRPDIGKAAAEEAFSEIRSQITGSHMVFVAAGMGGGTGTGAAPVIARAAKEEGILTVGVVTKPFRFEGQRRMQSAEAGILELKKHVDTLIVIPNQNLFRIANEKTTFAEAFKMADNVLYSGVSCITDLIIRDGLINLDFADVKVVMNGMGSAMMDTSQAAGERRAILAAEEAIANPLLDNISLSGAKGILISITGGPNLTLYEVDEAASRIRKEVDSEANIIVGATFDNSLDKELRVSIVASGVAEGVAVNEPVTNQSMVNFQRLAKKLSETKGNASQPGLTESKNAEGQEGGSEAGNQVWQGSGDVTIEKRPPHFRSAPLPPPVPLQQSGAQGLESQFHPERPKENKMGPKRMPEIEDFPFVGQKELKAKLNKPVENSGDKQNAKVGLFQRIAGIRKTNQAIDSSANQSTDPNSHSDSEKSSDVCSNSATEGEQLVNNPQKRPTIDEYEKAISEVEIALSENGSSNDAQPSEKKRFLGRGSK